MVSAAEESGAPTDVRRRSFYVAFLAEATGTEADAPAGFDRTQQLLAPWQHALPSAQHFCPD
jgi:hypothetical protein